MQPIDGRYIHQAQQYLTDEYHQAWIATRHQGVNDVMTVRPNHPETNLTNYKLRYIVFQRLGMFSISPTADTVAKRSMIIWRSVIVRSRCC